MLRVWGLGLRACSAWKAGSKIITCHLACNHLQCRFRVVEHAAGDKSVLDARNGLCTPQPQSQNCSIPKCRELRPESLEAC